jgi:hypothetical protein
VSQRGPIFQLASAKIAAKNVAAQKDEKKNWPKKFRAEAIFQNIAFSFLQT